jgi:hypothetical protein
MPALEIRLLHLPRRCCAIHAEKSKHSRKPSYRWKTRHF